MTDHAVDESAQCELDTRADTICAGKNFHALAFTGQSCNVKGFHDSFDLLKNIPVARVATAVRNAESGQTYILIVNEALYFGPSMDHSLINPNQIRKYGIPVCDDPFDRDRDFGISHDDLFIPFDTAGSTVFFETYCPSDEELQSCQHIELTDGDTEWNPTSVKLSQVSTVEPNCVSDYPCETDMVLNSICPTLVWSSMNKRLIASVKVDAPSNIARKAMATKSLEIRESEVLSKTRHSVITAEHIARTFNIGLDKAKKTLEVTTQKGIHTAIAPLFRRYRTDHISLHLDHLRSQWYVDWMPAKTKSITGCTGAFVYTNGKFTEVYPKTDHGGASPSDSLNEFCQDVSIPGKLKSDLAKEFVGPKSEFNKLARRRQIDLTYAEAKRTNEVFAVDIEIREMKKRWHSKMVAKSVPKRLWDFGLKHTTKILQCLPHSLESRTGYKTVTGKTPDISEFCDFDFWDLVWYFPGKHPNVSVEDRALGRWARVSHNIGRDMCYWIIPVSGIPISDTTVQHVTREEIRDNEIKIRVDEFDTKMRERMDYSNFQLPNMEGFHLEDIEMPSMDPAYGDETTTPADNDYGDPIIVPEADDVDYDS